MQPNQLLMTPCRSRIREVAPCDRDELPPVTCRIQGQLQDAERAIVAYFAVRDGRALELTKTIPSSAHYELSDAPRRIGLAVRLLWRESLVDVVVSGQYDVCVVFVKRLPERFEGRVAAMSAGTEARVVPIGEGARCLVGGEIRAKPLLLGRAALAGEGGDRGQGRDLLQVPLREDA